MLPPPRLLFWRAISLVNPITAALLLLFGGILLLPPQATGSTLLGGLGGHQLGGFSILLAWLLLGLGWLASLDGARPAYALGSLAFGAWAALQWLLYPDDHGGNLIFSPQRDELWGLAWAGVFAALPVLLLPRRRHAASAPLRWALIAALLLTWISMLPLVKDLSRPSAPSYCEFDRDGRQLSICLE